jgi:hypothetical protein
MLAAGINSKSLHKATKAMGKQIHQLCIFQYKTALKANQNTHRNILNK